MLGLGKMADADALDLLTAALRDPGSEQPLRDAVLEAVEMIGSKKAAVALAGLLGQKTFSAERKPRVIAALGRLKDPIRHQAAARDAQDSVAGGEVGVDRSSGCDRLEDGGQARTIEAVTR